MFRHTYLPALCALLLLASCESAPVASPDPDPDSGVIMPLKVGNRWIGKLTTRANDGSVVSVAYDTLTILSEMPAADGVWFLGSDSVLYMNADDGLRRHSAVGCHCMIARYPATVGETFNPESMTMATDSISTEMVTTMAVIARDTSITVSAGLYSCYGYQLQIVGSVDYRFIHGGERSYYAPNVGPVRRELPDGSRAWELVSVSLR